jgi:hypothetical protein
MPRKPKTPEITPNLVRALREERNSVTPVIDGEELALTRFLRRSGVECTSHSKPALARLICEFLRHRKRH